MRARERRELRELYGYRCGYCGVGEMDAGAEFTIDHFQPVSQSGPNEPFNWVYCCFACNTYKGDYWQPDSIERILHPLSPEFGVHIAVQADGTLRGLTPTGEFHIRRLHLNRPQLISHRLKQRSQESLKRRMHRVVSAHASLRRQVDALGEAIAEVMRTIEEL